ITLLVTAGIFSAMNPSTGAFRTQPEVVDMQQRLRVGVDRLQHDISLAAAGSNITGLWNISVGGFAVSGVAPPGSVKFFLPAIFPRHVGVRGLAGVETSTVVRDDAITILYVPTSKSSSMIPVRPNALPGSANGMADASSDIKISWPTGCPNTSSLCGV